MNEWKEYTVQDLIDQGMLTEPMDGNHGSIHPKSSDYVSEGVPFIMANDLVNGVVDLINCSFISEKQAKTLKKGFAHPNDVLLTHKATIGRTAIVPNKYETIILTPQVTYYRVLKGIDNRYLKYYFDSDFFQNTLRNWAGSGSTRAYIGITAQRKLPIILPPLNVQTKIATVLSLLDEKISLNIAINENLEQQAQAIFKAWFVDFEPFGGVMPDDWRIGTLSEICGYSKDKVDIDDLTLDTYYSTENMQPNRQGAVQATTLPTIKQTTACKKGDVLISNIRPYFKKILYCFSDCGCSTDVLCFVPNKTDYSAFLYCALYADRFFDYMVAGSKGTKMPRGDKQQIMVYPICIPSAEYIEKFNQAVAPMLETVYTNRIEANNLANLRDTLLPKLMNGEIDVSAVRI